jgi:hypothetical protein
VIRWLVTPRSLARNARWLWRFQLVRRLARPRCHLHPERRGEVYYGRVWWCRQHPLMVPGRAAGHRPPLRVYTRAQSERLFRSSEPPGEMWRSEIASPPASAAEAANRLTGSQELEAGAVDELVRRISEELEVGGG